MKHTIPLAVTEESALIVEGTVSAALVTILQTAVLRMIPFAVPAIALLFLDLLYGCRAAKYRGEPVRISTAIRRTTTKFFGYVCWLILSSTLAIAFDKDWLEWGTLGLVYANEGLSIIGNYLETKGINFSIVNVYKWVIKVFAKKVTGEEMSDDEAGSIISTKTSGSKKKKEKSEAA